MKIYEITAIYEVAQHVKIKANSKKEAEKLLREEGMLGNNVEEIENGNFGDLIEICHVKKVK